MSDWQPIETAPKYGSILLGRWYRKEWIWVATWGYAGPATWQRAIGSRGAAPTHWAYVSPPSVGMKDRR